MKKILIILIVYFLFLNKSIANNENCEIIEDIYKKYECRVKKVCEEFKENKVVFNTIKYKKASEYEDQENPENIFLVSKTKLKPIKARVANYKNNMNSIYNCAIINVQKNSINMIKQKLLSLDKTGDLKKYFEPKIQNTLTKIDLISEKSKCVNIDKKTIFNKLSILRQTTYETCKFNYYAEYLKEYYNNTSNALKEELEKSYKNEDKETLNLANIEVANKIKDIKSSIDAEVNQAYKIFSIAYHAYSEYENNFPIHFLLELLKHDFYIFREKLHQVINPISQVGYKIMNAMSK